MTWTDTAPLADAAQNIVHLQRVLRAPRSRVFEAFLNADALAKWLPPHGFTGRIDDMDAAVGGGYQATFINFSSGEAHGVHCRFTDIRPDERICYTTRFDDPDTPDEMTTTMECKAVLTGTQLTLVQTGLPASIPVEFATMGWQESLALLAYLVEPEIIDGRGHEAGRRIR